MVQSNQGESVSGTSKRLDVLNTSLIKKEEVLDRRFDQHFSTVRESNGQPLNDKRNGASTLARWEKQSDGIRNQKAEIEKTKSAIEREQGKIADVEYWYKKMPKYLTDLIDDGKIKQWRRHPRMLFVTGVDKARLVFDEDDGLVRHRYVKEIKDQEQFAIFRDLFNSINKMQGLA